MSNKKVWFLVCYVKPSTAVFYIVRFIINPVYNTDSASMLWRCTRLEKFCIVSKFADLHSESSNLEIRKFFNTYSGIKYFKHKKKFGKNLVEHIDTDKAFNIWISLVALLGKNFLFNTPEYMIWISNRYIFRSIWVKYFLLPIKKYSSSNNHHKYLFVFVTKVRS